MVLNLKGSVVSLSSAYGSHVTCNMFKEDVRCHSETFETTMENQ
jgi:hypothetical protein